MSEEERADRRAYVQALIEYARDDARQVYIRVTAALAVTTLFVTQIPFKNLQALSRFWTDWLYIGLALLIVAALLYFKYVGDLHAARRQVAKYLLHLDRVISEEPTGQNSVERILSDIERARAWWAFAVADVLFTMGGLMLAVVLAIMVAGDQFSAS